MSEATATQQPSGSPPPSNSPFAQPVSPARTEADAATARTNAEVVRPDLGEARRQADLPPADRYAERNGVPQGERLGDRKLSQAEYDKLTVSEKYAYAERATERAKGGGDPEALKAKVKFGDLELTETELHGLMERKGLEDSRKLTLPGDPSKYALTLPKDFVVPQGIEYKIDEKSPAATLARQFAHDAGLSQDQFSRMVAIHAAVEVQQVANLKTARDAEVSKLGATASQRITAAETFLRGNLGDDLGKAMSGMMVTAKHVEGFERLMQKFGVSNGSTSYKSGGRGPDDAPGRMSDTEWNSMSYSQQKEYAARASAGSEGRR